MATYLLILRWRAERLIALLYLDRFGPDDRFAAKLAGPIPRTSSEIIEALGHLPWPLRS